MMPLKDLSKVETEFVLERPIWLQCWIWIAAGKTLEMGNQSGGDSSDPGETRQQPVTHTQPSSHTAVTKVRQLFFHILSHAKPNHLYPLAYTWPFPQPQAETDSRTRAQNIDHPPLTCQHEPPHYKILKINLSNFRTDQIDTKFKKGSKT